MTTITRSRQPADLPAVSDRLAATCGVDHPYVGPPTSGHGGVLAGRLAQLLDPGAGVVRLHVPIPLGTSLTLGWGHGSVIATSGGDFIAMARHLVASLAVAPFDPVDDGDLAQSRLSGRAGRRLFVEGAIAGAAGEVLAVSTATWFAMEVTGS